VAVRDGVVDSGQTLHAVFHRRRFSQLMKVHLQGEHSIEYVAATSRCAHDCPVTANDSC
jgi:hypothetical protein